MSTKPGEKPDVSPCKFPFPVVPLPSPSSCPAAAAAAGASKLLVISGGDGYEDFSPNGANSDMVGRDDSTNHLLLWQV